MTRIRWTAEAVDDLQAIRELIKPPYRIVYRLHNEAVDILTVFRSSRAFPAI